MRKYMVEKFSKVLKAQIYGSILLYNFDIARSPHLYALMKRQPLLTARVRKNQMRKRRKITEKKKKKS